MMATLTQQLDAAIDRLQDVHDSAIDDDQDEAATKLEEAIEALRDVNFNDGEDEEGSIID
jgi:uncharacterized protein YgfB (UPF0149 family)